MPNKETKANNYKINRKKNKDKRLICNWRSISLLNVEEKIISKALSERLKNILLPLIPNNQFTYGDKRYISEGGRLISDVLQISDVLKLNGRLVTVDIQKAFDFAVNHQF